jgi:hypothetical protein
MNYSTRFFVGLSLMFALGLGIYWKSHRVTVFYNDKTMTTDQLLHGDGEKRYSWQMLLSESPADVIVIGIGGVEDPSYDYKENLRTMVYMAKDRGKAVELDTTLVPERNAKVMREVAAEFFIPVRP